ncbi:MAG: YegS/Rv2252/BmrU family lipid kinase [Cellulosilyticum sp.]|nr:YegS/Rv2252/BmrU family lipid kinase [Cellulosilyticum sp.]
MSKPKQAILLYNAYAGHRTIVSELDRITERLQELGYDLRLHRSTAPGDIRNYVLEHVAMENTDLILISGGDGTVNECVSAMCEKDLDIPLMILPLGTANDFANSAGIPSSVDGCLDLMTDGNLGYIDVGQVNERYFINVCNMGLFSGVSHNVDPELKKKFGRLAYYFKGFEEIQNCQAMDITLTADGEVLKDKYLLILVFNGKGAGGMLKLAKNAEITDGKLDVICIKNLNIFEMPALMFKVLQGEHLKDVNVDYLTSSHIKIECHNQTENQFVTDVDGEAGPSLPMEIKVLSNKIRIFLPKE